MSTDPKPNLTKSSSERRFDARFDKIIPVVVASELFGDTDAVARNLSAGGMYVEMSDPLPIGSVVTVNFQIPDSHGVMAVQAEVKHHYAFNYNINGDPAFTRGIGLRFLEFLSDTEDTGSSFSRRRILH